MQTIWILKGLPGSGKSTWAKEQVLREPGKYKRINKDDLRAMLDAGKWSPENEKFVLGVRNSIATDALRRGMNVIVDDTNLDSDHYKNILNLVKSLNIEAFVTEKFFPCDIDECIKRDAARSHPVGEDVILKMAKRYPRATAGKPKCETVYKMICVDPYQPTEDLPKALICDLDGTLALIDHRNPYDASLCELDGLCVPVANTVKAFYEKGYKIIFASGRMDDYRPQTENFLKYHLPDMEYLLLMRKSGDSRKDSIIKREIFDNHIRNSYNVEFVLDDRNSVVQTWRHELGLTCFQVADGNF